MLSLDFVVYDGEVERGEGLVEVRDHGTRISHRHLGVSLDSPSRFEHGAHMLATSQVVDQKVNAGVDGEKEMRYLHQAGNQPGFISKNFEGAGKHLGCVTEHEDEDNEERDSG